MSIREMACSKNYPPPDPTVNSGKKKKKGKKENSEQKKSENVKSTKTQNPVDAIENSVKNIQLTESWNNLSKFIYSLQMQCFKRF